MKKKPVTQKLSQNTKMLIGFFVLLLIILGILFVWTRQTTTPQIDSNKPTGNEYTYTCPSGKYVNCMPGPVIDTFRCNKVYIEWAEKNCPGFKGATY